MEICKLYGWTYKEFQETPMDFIDLILERMKIDAEKAKVTAKP